MPGHGSISRTAAARLLSCAAAALALAAAPATAAPTPRIAYVTGLAGTRPQVRIANADGTGAALLGPGADATLAPDGQQVAIVTSFTRSGASSLLVRPAGGGGAARPLVRSSRGSILEPVWSPDSRLVAVVVDETRLVVVNAATGARRVVAQGQIQGASFSPQSDRVVYGISRSLSLSSPVNVWVADVDGSLRHAITHDGRSLNPLWGPRVIAYSHERLRRGDAPVYQLRIVRPDGHGVRQLTHMRIPPLVSGLSPTAWSADGRRLLAEFGGQDTSEAWTVNAVTGRARDLTGRIDGVIGRGLSQDGRTVLVQRGFFDDPAHQSVATIPFGGGHATVLARRGSAPSWDR
jgi:Tol biopolymer transport system component